jgi:hypothetical protein
LLGWLAKDPAAALAQAGALSLHASGDPFDARNFRRAEPENIARAKSPLILLRERAAHRRQHRQAKRQDGHEREISEFEQINSHRRRPQKSTSIAVAHHAVRHVRINQDRIETSAGTARFSKRYAPAFSIAVAFRLQSSTDGTSNSFRAA